MIWWVLGVAAIVIMLALFARWQNGHISITRYVLPSAHVERGLRVVQVSDVHDARLGQGNARLLDAVRAASPDMICITGDLVSRWTEDTSPMEALLKALISIAPVFYISGNHEYGRLEREAFFRRARQTGAILLRNELYTGQCGGETICVAGLDEIGYRDAGALLGRAASCSGFKLVLNHHAHLARSYARPGIDLILTGHAHGGQFILPLVGAVYAPGQGLFPQFTDGLHRAGETAVAVSRGMGNSRFPLRLFNFPELVVLDIWPKHAGNS